MATATGLDVLARDRFEPLLGKTLAVVCNQATVSHDYVHLLDLLLPLHREGSLKIQIVFGPQHGLFGHTQDNMIEWEGHTDSRTGLKVASLYGHQREPSHEQLKGVDLVLLDLPDIGSRYYTFLWTTALCMKVCAEAGTPMTILDRPNPISGFQVEGTVLDPAYASFVGLYPLPTRHGMTLAEIGQYLRNRYFHNCELSLVTTEGWSRSDYLEDTDAPWVMPSPNMPTIDTAVVYPGGCLLEGTNLSEGRGTTRPFEIFGAPYLKAWELADALNELELPGVYFRPIQFQPTFQKHAGQLCDGCFIHVTERRAFEPVLCFVAIMQQVRRLAKDKFRWNDPPYEYEQEKLPIDILAGNSVLRQWVDDMRPLKEVREQFLRECHEFEPYRKAASLYANG